jgi:protein-L-isoaspartate O-methyltransferase
VEAEAEINSELALALVMRQGSIVSAQSQPKFVLRLLAMLRPTVGESILEVGFASGWLASLACRLVGSAGRVHGIEIDVETFELAMRHKDRFPPNFTYQCGDVTDLYDGEFDVIISTSAGGTDLGLLGRLTNGGRASSAFRIRGGGDCTYLFRRQGSFCHAYASEYTASVPSCGHLALEPQDGVSVSASALQRHLSFELDAWTFGGSNRVLNFVRLRDFLFRRRPDFVLVKIHNEHGRRLGTSFGVSGGDGVAFLAPDGLLLLGDSATPCSILIAEIEAFTGMRRTGLSLQPVIHFECETPELLWAPGPDLPRIFTG